MSEITTNDILQHVGVKGMKWGVRRSNSGSSRKGLLVTKTKPKVVGKSLQKSIKSQIKKANARERTNLDNFHEKKMGSKRSGMYQKNYNKALKKNRNSHYAAVRSIRNTEMQVRRTRATLVATVVAPEAGRLGKKVAQAAYKKATSPEAIRAGKNIILAAKRSKVRVVDGSTMENVIGAAFNNRLG